MSQQINLLRRTRPYARLVVLGSAAGGLAVLLLLGGVTAYLQRQNNQMQAQVAQLQQASSLWRAQITRLSSADDELTALQAEIRRLQPQQDAAKELVASVRSGPLGSAEGHAGTLMLLSQVRAPDAWLTSIELRHKTRPLVLTGVAFNEQAASAYAQRLNQQLAATELQLQGMDIVRQAEGAAGGKKPASVLFKLN